MKGYGRKSGSGKSPNDYANSPKVEGMNYKVAGQSKPAKVGGTRQGVNRKAGGSGY